MTLSVVTVVRNARRDLAITAASVQAQTARDRLEYVIVDGASEDGTAELANELGRRGQAEVTISEPDGGIYEAMNKALGLVRGEWVLFLNSGDEFYSPQTVEDLLRQAERFSQSPYGCAGVYGACVQVLPNGKELYSPPLPPRKVYWRMICSHQSLMLRTEIAREYRFDTRFRIAADHHQLMRLVYRFEPLWPVDLCVARVRLERYSWAQLRQGLNEKRRAAWEVTHNPLVDLGHRWRYLGVGLKHLARRVLRGQA